MQKVKVLFLSPAMAARFGARELEVVEREMTRELEDAVAQGVARLAGAPESEVVAPAESAARAAKVTKRGPRG